MSMRLPVGARLGAAMLFVAVMASAGVSRGEPRLDVGPETRAELIRGADEAALTNDAAPPPLALPAGTIALSEQLHLVPIHLYPLAAGQHESFVFQIDGEHGLPPLKLVLGGTDILGGASGEMNLGRFHVLRGTVIKMPSLIMVSVEDTATLWRARLPGNRLITAGLRAGGQVWDVPNLIIAQAYLQAGARIDGLFNGKRNIHLDTFAGSGSVATFGYTDVVREKTTPGLEISTELVFER